MEYETYYESAEDVIISKQRAIQELKNHGVVYVEEFFGDVGEKDSYNAQDVLAWLGY